MKRTRWLVLALALGLALATAVLIVPNLELANAWTAPSAGPRPLEAMTGRAPPSPADLAASDLAGGAMGPADLAGSWVSTEECYQSPKQQVMCFTIYNGSIDGEWVRYVELTFPTMAGDWEVQCNSAWEDPTDSVGYAVNFTCTEPITNRVLYQSADGDGFGEISNGASWGTCVDVNIPAGYTGDRFVAWALTGDETPTPSVVSDSTKIEQCMEVMLKPVTLTVEGCNGLPQVHEIELRTYYGGSLSGDLHYAVPSANAVFTGPTRFENMSEGEIMTFTVELEPDRCLEAGDKVTATLTAESDSPVYVDTTTILHEVTSLQGWRRRTDSISPTMDNVVVWASHRDGGLWSIGGYGSNGATQRYNPSADTWETFLPETVITPPIEYPVDGCYGLDGPDPDTAHEIVVLFPDTLVTDSLHVYDITANSWYTRLIPTQFYTSYIGHWGFDVVSLLGNPYVKPGIVDTNMCYLSGGNHEKPGGGTTRNLWRYDPETNDIEHVGDFADTNVVFGFHASWYVPWIGTDGSICVAGGADHNHYIHDKTQCYDLAADAPAGQDLGTLPEPWWGMADGWQTHHGEYQIWIANGVAQDGTLLPVSAYASESSGGFQYGPEMPVGMYRLEGASYNGRFYTLSGSRGGFWYSDFAFLLAQCPWCHSVFQPLTMRNY